MKVPGARTLRQALGWRLAGAGLLSLAVLVLVLVAVYAVQHGRLERQWMQDAQAHFDGQTRRLDDDWQRQAELLRAQIEFSGALDDGDPRVARARLTALLANQGGQGTFTHVRVFDDQGQALMSYGTRSGGTAPAPGPGPRSWAYSEEDRLVYRVIRAPVRLGPHGRGELVLHVPLNNATLATIAFPSARLSLHWQGIRDLAYSDALLGSATASFEGKPLRESFFPWATAAGSTTGPAAVPAPELHVYRLTQEVLPLAELLVLTALGTAAGCVIAWLVIGRWAQRHVRRIDTLSSAVDRFAQGGPGATRVGKDLQAATEDADLELQQLGQGLAAMMQASETADVEKAAARQRLAELNATLEQRVAERTAELARARDDALAAARTRQQILAGVSHELRTPLVGLMGSLELVDSGPLAPEHKHLLEVAARSGQALRNVIDDVLDYSRLEAVGAQLRQLPFHLGDLAAEAAALHAAVALNKGLRLACHRAPGVERRVRGDPVRLRQVLLNLLGNALKFTDQGSVELRLSVASQPAAAQQLAVRFEVHDTGIGIDAEAQQRLFSPFVQADSTLSQARGGTGLGLAIAQRLIVAMGGRIALRSTPGAGSVFWFELLLPLAGDDATAAAAAPTLPERHHGRVLLVEDDAVNRIIVTEMLRRLGAEVQEAENGLLALEALRREPFDLVLMDQQMPLLDGLGATTRIRAGEAGEAARGVTIIAVTANAQEGDAERCIAAGMNDHLPKPFTQAELARKLERWLPQKAAADTC